MREKIQDVLNTHAQKAAASEYDRAVCISAIAATRNAICEFLESAGPQIDADMLMQKLQALHAGYHDPDGQYTSGKGVIGDLIADIGVILKQKDP